MTEMTSYLLMIVAGLGGQFVPIIMVAYLPERGRRPRQGKLVLLRTASFEHNL
jgi:hypothetical protein